MNNKNTSNNAIPFLFWIFLALMFHICGGNWVVGLTIGIGISLLAILI